MSDRFLPSDRRYPDTRLRGLRTYATAQKQRTVERLQAAIDTLHRQGDNVTAHTIYATCGLHYTAYARNPEALALFRTHSAHLIKKRKIRTRTKKVCPEGLPRRRDPLLAYTRPQLVARVRSTLQRLEQLEGENAHLLQERVECDVKILQLEAQVAEFQRFLVQMRTQRQREEHEG
jgi:hypothetical protein